MGSNHNNYNNQTLERQEETLPQDLLERPYAEQIRLMLGHIIPAAVIGCNTAKDQLGAEEVTAFDVCATLAIGCVELRTYLLTGIDIRFCSQFALDMPGVPYADRALWEIVHLPGFDTLPHVYLLPFTQEDMRLAVVAQIAADMAGTGINEPLSAELLDRQIAHQEQQTRELVQSGDMTSFSMATETDRAISLIRLRLAGMDGVAVHVRQSNLSTLLGDLARNFPTVSFIAIDDHSNPISDDASSPVSSHDYLGWLKA